jgi:hypothetical protein
MYCWNVPMTDEREEDAKFHDRFLWFNSNYCSVDFFKWDLI